MAYQKCINKVISLLKNNFLNKVWNECDENTPIYFFF